MEAEKRFFQNSLSMDYLVPLQSFTHVDFPPIIIGVRAIRMVSYISSIEYIDLGVDMKERIENAKASFRSVRDSILDKKVSGESAAQSVQAELEQIKDKLIDDP